MDWPARHHVNAVIGWLSLGNIREARGELEQLNAAERAMPEALSAEWQVLAAEKRWEEAAATGHRWVETAPEAPEAWIQRSFALHEQQQTQEALDKLLPAAQRFPDVNTISYNLACYACRLGQLDSARRWLRRTMLSIKDKSEMLIWSAAAQRDRDLEPLWDEIREGKLR